MSAHEELRERLAKLPKYDRGINWQLRNWQGAEELTVYGETANLFKWILDNTNELIASLQSPGLKAKIRGGGFRKTRDA